MENDSDWIMFFEHSLGPTIWYSETPFRSHQWVKKQIGHINRVALLPEQCNETLHRLRTFWISVLFNKQPECFRFGQEPIISRSTVIVKTSWNIPSVHDF